MIGVVILNYNTYPDTIRLVEALQSQTLATELRVVVVDNASPNDSFSNLKPLEKRFDHVHVLQTGENLGYAKGNNFGLKFLEENIKPTYAAILNNDVFLPDDCFEKLTEKYRILDNPCIIAPTQLNPEGKITLMGNLPRFRDDLLNLSFIYRRIRKHKAKVVDNTGQQAMRVDTIPGSFMFFSLEKFKRAGYFYPGTFLYAEERFIGYFIKEQGFHNYVLTDGTYVHHHSTTIKAHHDTYSRYKMSYAGWLEYARVCRKNGKLKAWVLKPLTKISLMEIRVISLLKIKRVR